ncbi:MAG: isoprenylcysteine carboxylmethyltransferase family protein [Gemmatimonadaceae bacterium]
MSDTARDDRWLFARALLAFLALPGVVAFVVPLALLRPAGIRALTPAGGVVVSVGIVLLLWCVRDFYVAGRGTLAPWSPPRHLVQVGLYRVSRNPMYLGVLVIVTGWAIGFGSRALAVYAMVLAVAFHLRVRYGEEPWLARRHGAAWDTYRARVRRWL